MVENQIKSLEKKSQEMKKPSDSAAVFSWIIGIILGLVLAACINSNTARDSAGFVAAAILVVPACVFAVVFICGIFSGAIDSGYNAE